MTNPELDPGALDRLHERLAAHVESGDVPGLIALVARGDAIHVDVLGHPAVGGAAPLARDAIFRIASLTKPITAAAAMILVDDGVIAPDDDIDEFIPELRGRRVLRTLESELDDTVPAHRSITVDDLLTCRLGLGCIMAPPDTYPIQVAERELELTTFGPPWPPPRYSVDEWITRLGTLPLVHQPGDGWMYNTGIEVLGVLVERASGKPFETFLRERLFEPLGMRDTTFLIDAHKLDRFTTEYAPDLSTGELHTHDSPATSMWSEPAIPNGAAWLLSTIDDYWAFVSMLVGGGETNGVRVLQKASVARMIVDHLHERQRAEALPFVGAASSWGYGLAVPAAGVHLPGVVPHGYGWDGGSGTSWRTDPTTGTTGILFTQRMMVSPELPAVAADFHHGVDAAVAR